MALTIFNNLVFHFRRMGEYKVLDAVYFQICGVYFREAR